MGAPRREGFPFTNRYLASTIYAVDQPRRQFLAETEDLIEQVFAALDELRDSLGDGQI